MTSKERFKANIRAIEIEPHSFCNRTCWFCPNSFIDRRFKPVKFLDWQIYTQVLRDLQSIDYSETACFAGWCEPFSQTEVLDYIQEARKFLPNAYLYSNTNTDYLTIDYVREVAKAGLDVLRAQLYFDKDEKYNDLAILAKMRDLQAKLPGIKFNQSVKNQWFALVNGTLVIHAYSKDFHVRGYNRCDMQLTPAGKRIQTCGASITGFGINYNGWAVPCCQIRSDYPKHKDLLLGEMNDKPGRIFELYQGLVLPETEYPCSTCMFQQNHANPRILYPLIKGDLQNG